jgi:C-lobe and N-lobe beta barrels of Tf-binding protein B
MFKTIFFYTFCFLTGVVNLSAGSALVDIDTKLPVQEAVIVGDLAGDIATGITQYEEGQPVFGFNKKYSGQFIFELENAEFQSFNINFDDGLQIDLSEDDLIHRSNSPVSPYKNIPFQSRDSFQVKHSHKIVNDKFTTTTVTFSFSHLKKSYCSNKKTLLSGFQYVGWGMWEYMNNTPYWSNWGKRYQLDQRFGLASFGTQSDVTVSSLELPKEKMVYRGPVFSYIPRGYQLPEESVGVSEFSIDLDSGVLSGVVTLGTGDQLDLVNGSVDREVEGMPFVADVTFNGVEVIGQIRGKFYGPTGQEIAGVFLLDTDDAGDYDEITGVFAASREYTDHE